MMAAVMVSKENSAVMSLLAKLSSLRRSTTIFFR